MTTATKCIAVKTPFGNMYCEFDGVNYVPVIGKADIQPIRTIGSCFDFRPFVDGWVMLTHKATHHASGYLEISAHYGDQFPQ